MALFKFILLHTEKEKFLTSTANLIKIITNEKLASYTDGNKYSTVIRDHIFYVCLSVYWATINKFSPLLISLKTENKYQMIIPALYRKPELNASLPQI